MAEMNSRNSFSLITLCSVFVVLYMSSVIVVAVDGKSQTFGRVLSPTKLGLKTEKLSHFRVYWHDIVGGRNPTSIQVAKAASTDKSATGFGAVSMIDDPLTEGLKLSSKLVGRGQGFYAYAGTNELVALINMNFAFLVGKYNGNEVLSEVREMPIVGGSGLFRFATMLKLGLRNWILKPYYAKKLDSKTGDSTVEYNIYVFHY
ncbi:hypothetical protein MKX03_018550 [Papaver bracteatum]|nr:hypothetical protein MKX03_018550 [Papaver bracteatum]